MLMKIINVFLISIIVCIVAFFSVFWIGTQEAKIELMKNLPLSFVLRLGMLLIIGIIGIVILILSNYLIKKIFKIYSVDLKRLTINSMIVIVSVALIGNTIFFFV